MAKLFRSCLQKLDLGEIDENEIVAMLISVNQKTSNGMISLFVETCSGSYRFENMVHKIATLLVDGSHRQPFHLKILFTLLKKAKPQSDSIIILLLSTMVHDPSLKIAIWEGLSSLGLMDSQRALLSFVSEIKAGKRKSLSKKIKRRLRDWLKAWKHHFDKNICATIENIDVDQTSAFQMSHFLLRKIELVAEEKYLRGSKLIELEFTSVPTKNDLRNDFTRDRLVEENFDNLVTTLLEDVLEDARFEIKSIEILNYFVETVGKYSSGRSTRESGKLDVFDKYGPDAFPLTS